MPGALAYPKIELHVHLEATVLPELLFEIARRNGVELPASSVEALRRYYRADSFEQFIARWIATSRALCRADDFREVVVDYAGRAKE